MTLLPLLFGIVGGASGISIAKMDVSTQRNKRKIHMLGAMLAAFSVACTVALIAGVYVRPMVQDFNRVSLAYGSNSGELIDGLILRRKLQAVGASDTEITHLFEILSKEPNTALADDSKKIDEAIILAHNPAVPDSNDKKKENTDDQLKWMSDPDQWPAPPHPSAPKPSTENEKWRFPLAYEQWKANPSGATLWGYKMPDGEQLLLLPRDSWRGG